MVCEEEGERLGYSIHKMGSVLIPQRGAKNLLRQGYNSLAGVPLNGLSERAM